MATAEERILALTRNEDIFSLAVPFVARSENRIGENSPEGKKSHQGIFLKKRKTASGAMWVKWPGTHQVSGQWWSETVLGIVIDANGNTLTDAGGKTYSWDFENRLVQAVAPGTNGGTTTFKYDPFGRRIEKSSWLGTTNYLYDSVNNIEVVDSSGNVLAKYSEGSYIDEWLAELSGGTTSYFQQDALSSISSLSNPVGVLANTYTYDGFGKLTASTGTLTNPFQFTGREVDLETGIYEYRARYYSPTIGRFLSEDPLRFGPGDPNFYDYVGDNPALYTDPTGRFRIPGTNWCGPDWTGGQREPYNPAHASIYKPPTNWIDTVCMHHDICYFKCRSTNPCSASGRSTCMKTCDQIFVGEMPLGQGRGGLGMEADAIAAAIYWHQFFPDREPNQPGCGCGGK